MNRRDFLFFRKNSAGAAELSCEQLYMRYLDSTLDGTTGEFFKRVEDSLSGFSALRLTDSGWLQCGELKPIESVLARFRSRGGRIDIQTPEPKDYFD